MIRALIVDDEPLARAAVRSLAADHPDFLVVGEAGNTVDALRAIADHRPDLVFLDVQMPGEDGFTLVESLGQTGPAIVFVTAHDEHAARAFAVDAVDYLLKPFDDLAFARVAARVRRRLALMPFTGFLVARVGGARRILPLDRIDWIGTTDGYSEVHGGGRSVLLDEPLTSLARRLPDRFARVHRSAIVPLDRVRELRLGPHGDGEVMLACGTRLRVSRRYRAALDGHLGG